MKRRTHLLALPLAALLLAGCASHPPILEEKAAESALMAAEPLAKTYAEDLFLEAQKTFDDAKLEIEKQVETAGFGQSFADARQKMIDAKAKAEEALRVAQANQQQAKTEVEAGMADLEASLQEVNDALSSVRKTRANRSARSQFESELELLTTAIEESKLLMSDETYLETLEQIKEFQARISEIRAGVDQLAAG